MADPISVLLEELYAAFQATTRRIILSSLGPHDIDDKVHDCFVIVLQAIRAGEIREPEKLVGFVGTVVRRYIIRQIHAAVDRRKRMVDCDVSMLPVRDHRENPEQAVLAKQRMELARRALRSVDPGDRDVLYRCYVDEQPVEQICHELRLRPGQFAMRKMRAKARVAAKYRRLAA